MIATIALARDFHQPIGLRALQMGKLLLDAVIKENATRRRFHVREWLPSDGGFQGWICKSGEWSWHHFPPRLADELFTIVRLSDNARQVAPRRWWNCDPRGMPRDDDAWAGAAWRSIEMHHAQELRWFR